MFFKSSLNTGPTVIKTVALFHKHDVKAKRRRDVLSRKALVKLDQAKCCRSWACAQFQNPSSYRKTVCQDKIKQRSPDLIEIDWQIIKRECFAKAIVIRCPSCAKEALNVVLYGFFIDIRKLVQRFNAKKRKQRANPTTIKYTEQMLSSLPGPCQLLYSSVRDNCPAF